MDPRIADYIRANRRRYTRDAIRQQLIDAGHDPAEIDATWRVLDTPDADDVAGEGFWSRFWLYLIGVNLVVFAVVAVATGMLTGIGRGGETLLVIFGIALVFAALIAWAVVRSTRPTYLGRGTAMAIGAIIPALLALLNTSKTIWLLMVVPASSEEPWCALGAFSGDVSGHTTSHGCFGCSTRKST
jgi:hypothetical protein